MAIRKKIGSGFFHPLAGSNPKNFIQLLWRNGISAKRLPTLMCIGCMILARYPFSLIERGISRFQIARMPEMPPPIFIIGHWRSGTTHLNNVLAQSPRFACVNPIDAGMPWELLTLGKYLKSLIDSMLPGDRLNDAVPVTPNSPQEDESAIGNMVPVSFFHAFYFPQKLQENFDRGLFFEGCSEKEITAWKRSFVYFMQKLSIRYKHHQLLIKNPVYTARIRMIRSLWPNAKFIHIHRDPFRVFDSMRNNYSKLIPALSLQDYQNLELDDIIISGYARMMDRLLEERKELPAHDYVDIRYQDLDERPLQALEQIYQRLELSDWEADKLHYQTYLDSIHKFRKNTFNPIEEHHLKVAKAWDKYIRHWGYLRVRISYGSSS